jgi:hypothetical protein
MKYCVDLIVTVHVEADNERQARDKAIEEMCITGYDCEFSECYEDDADLSALS